MWRIRSHENGAQDPLRMQRGAGALEREKNHDMMERRGIQNSGGYIS